MKKITQLVPNFYGGDAISNQAAEMKEIFRSLGFKSEIFASSIDLKLKNKATFYKKYQRFSRPENLVFYHVSDPSPVTEFFKNLPDRKIIVYHNLTPQKFFRETKLFYPDDREAEIKNLIPFVEFAFGVSEFNRKELENFGFRRTGVMPFIFNPKKYNLAPDAKIIKKFRGGKDGKINLLFVGRIAPNKKIEDLLKIFYFYKTYLNPASRLILVGKIFELFEPYYHQLLQLAQKLGLEDVVFTSHVSQKELVSYYQVADIFLSASEHEGFGAPFLEAMNFGVPVVAFAAAAVAETLGGAGIIYQEKNFAHLAELIEQIIQDKKLKEKIIRRQNQRLKIFLPDKARKILADFLKSAVE